MKKVFLIGYMGVGKTTWGKRLANAMQISFQDLDEAIEDRESKAIAEIFDQKGEEYFREKETEILLDLCTNENSFVLSTGGGTATFERNMMAMKEAGVIVWLDLPLGMIQSRLAQSKTRPLLLDKTPDERKAFIESHFAQRLPYYGKADVRLDMSGMNSRKLEELVRLIQSR